MITVERELKNISNIKLHFKEMEKGGKKKYSATLLISAHSHPIEVSHNSLKADWEPIQIVHELIDKARRKINHQFKNDGQRPKKGAL